MIYEKISLREIYGARLRAIIMDRALSTYTTYDGHNLEGREAGFRSGESITFIPREVDL